MELVKTHAKSLGEEVEVVFLKEEFEDEGEEEKEEKKKPPITEILDEYE